MSGRDDGGPAFPRDHAHDGHNGMTLRDYFAAQIIGHLVATPERLEYSAEEDASYAYRMADAMLAERAKEKA